MVWLRFLILVAVLGISRPAHSCTCAEKPMDEAFDDALETSSMILCGRVIKKETHELEQEKWRVHTVLVQASWKGDVPDTVRVWSHHQSAACGADLQTDVDMLLFTEEQSGRQYVSSCSLKSPMVLAFFPRYRLGDPTQRQSAYHYKTIDLNDLFAVATAREERIRLLAAETLAAITDERDVIVPRLAAMLKSTSSNTHQSAVYALATMRNPPPEVADALDDALHNKSEARRLDAYTTLQHTLEGCRFLPYALKGLDDKADRIRATAARSLKGMGPCLSDAQKKSLKKAIDKAMDDSGDTTRCYLIKGLEECGCIAADWIPKLEKMKAQKKDKDNWVGYCAGQTAEVLKKACQ